MSRCTYPGLLALLQQGLPSQGTLHGDAPRLRGSAHGVELRGAGGGEDGEPRGLDLGKLCHSETQSAEDDRADGLTTSSQKLTRALNVKVWAGVSNAKRTCIHHYSTGSNAG